MADSPISKSSYDVDPQARRDSRVDYLYDGSFSGFLSCVYLHYYEAKASGIYTVDHYQGDLITPFVITDSDEDKSERVYRAIEGKISSYDLKRVYSGFCSRTPDKEMKLLKYIVKGFREGPGIRLLHGDPVVFDAEQMEKKVATEVHRMCGLIRFSEMRPAGGAGVGILYSPIEPDNDIIEFLADHFCDRLKEEAFIIHDKRRGKALIYARNDWYIGDFQDDALLEKTGAEDDYRRLWRGYFDSIAIKERTNPACQRMFMPVRYWKNLTEFSAV